jgi:Domain of unknown function (DUF6754)
MTAAGAMIVLATVALILVFTALARKGVPKLRSIPAFSRLYRAVGLSVEDGSRLLVSLGTTSLLTRYGASPLAGLELLRDATQRSSVSDRPPVAVAGEATLAFLAQDTLRSGFRAAGATELYQPTSGRLAGMTAFSSMAGTIPILSDEHVSVAGLVGHFGLEAAVLADVAERAGAVIVGGSDEPAVQAALYASASEVLLGEELFAGAAYLGDRAAHVGSLAAQDVLRWLLIAAMLGAAALKILAII